MDVMDAIRKRCSVRSYQDKAVEKEKLESVLEAARLALQQATARNGVLWLFRIKIPGVSL